MVAGGGHAWLQGGRAWLLGGCVGYDEIRSMSARYASYWNAFLFKWVSEILMHVYFYFVAATSSIKILVPV